MTVEQKERMKYEVEVQKARELKRIADALEIISGLKCAREVREPDVECSALVELKEKLREVEASKYRISDEFFPLLYKD